MVWSTGRLAASGHRSFVFQHNKTTFSLHIYLCGFKGEHQQAGRKRDKERRMKDAEVLRLGFIREVESVPVGS